MGKRDDICSFLGYEKDNPTKDRRTLLKATSTFLADYEARGSKVYGRKAESIGGRLCAMNFLEEEGRGERFWPPTPDGSLVYESARDKETIIDNVADLFLIHARSNYSKLHAKRRSKKHNDTSQASNVNNGHMDHQPPTSLPPEETYPEDEEPQFTYSPTVMTIEPELCLAPWLDPPKRFDRNLAIPWTESLNPRSLPDPPVRLGKKWLSQENVRWPAAVDKEIQYFMHRWLFYYTTDLENGTDDGIQSLVNLLRNDKGSSTELDSTQLRDFRRRIVDRVKFFTEAFISHQFVEIQANGVPQMTARFRNIWTTLKYETPTPRVNYRRRNVEDEAPRECPRKRRKLSKKAEDNALDSSRPKRKPWSEHAWRRKTIPPPADMTFPNLLQRKSSNMDPMTVVRLGSPQRAVDEESEGGEGGVSKEHEIHQGLETPMRNSKMSIETHPPRRLVNSQSDMVIKMEEESTKVVSQPGKTVMEFSSGTYPIDTIKVVTFTRGKVTKASSPDPDDIPTFEKTPPCLQDDAKVAEAQSPLPHQLNDTSDINGLSKQPQLHDIPVIATQSLGIVAASRQVDKVVDNQVLVTGSAQLLLEADNQTRLPQTKNSAPSPEVHGISQIIVEQNTQPLGLDGNGQSPKPELGELTSLTPVADRINEPPGQSASSHETAIDNDNQNASKFVASSADTSSETPQKYGPFHDLECLNKPFSSNVSRPTETHILRSTSSISPTSGAETYTREIDINLNPTNATQNPMSPRIAPSIDLNPEGDHHKELPSQGEVPVASHISNRPKTSEDSPEITDPQSSRSGQTSLLDALAKGRKPFEKSILSFARTPLPSVPLTSNNSQKVTDLLPAAQLSPTDMEESQKQTYQSPPAQAQQAIQNSQGALCEPLIATFQPINRPMSGTNSSPSSHPLSSAKEPSQLSPAPITHSPARSTCQPRTKSPEMPSQRQLHDIKSGYAQNEALPAQNIAYAPTMAGTSDFSWARDPGLNPHPIDTQNGVYPMAFIKKPAVSANGVWTQGTSRKRTLEVTSTKPRKTKSRKKSGLVKNLSTESANVQHPPVVLAHASQNIAPSAMQTQSPRQSSHHDREHSPKPPHPELISHLRLMDQNMGVNSGASYRPAFMTSNQPPSTSIQQLTNHTENADPNMDYDARREQNLLSYLALKENVNSIRNRSSQEWGKIKTSVDVHRATSAAVASSTQLHQTSGKPQTRPSPPENPRNTRSEYGTVEHCTNKDKGPPNIGEMNRTDSQNGTPGIQQNQALPNFSEKTRIKPQVGAAQSQAPSNLNIQSRSNIENCLQPSNSAPLGYSEQGRHIETEMRRGTFMDNGKGPAVPKDASVNSPKTPQNLKEPQFPPDHSYNHVRQPTLPTQTTQYQNQESKAPKIRNQGQYNPSSPGSYRSRDPWWNSLAADYNIRKISQPHSDSNTQHKRLMSKESTVSIIQTASPVPAGNQEIPTSMRQMIPRVSESSCPTGIQPQAHSFHTQGQPAQTYSSNRYSSQLSPIQPSHSRNQSVPPPPVVRTSTPLNLFSSQTSSQQSNGTASSPKPRFYQPQSQSSSNSPKTSSEGQYTNNASDQPSNTRIANSQHRFYNQPPIHPNTIQNSMPQNQSTNRPTQISPNTVSSPQSQYIGPHSIQQGSTAQVSCNPGYNEPQSQAASQYQYLKRAQNSTQAQKFTIQPQQQIYHGQQPLDWTQYQLHDPRSRNSMNSVNSSPRQPTDQAANTSPSQPPTNQTPVPRSSPAPILSIILNHSLPPTPPTPAILSTPRLDTTSQYPLGTHPLAGGSPRQQASAVNHTPKLDIIYPYSPTPTTPQGVGPKLDFYLQRSNSIIDTTNSFSYRYMESLSLSSLFSFFSQCSGVPAEKFGELTFRCMFGEYQQFVIGKNMGDGEWKRARKRIWRNWDREVKAARKNGSDEDEEFWEVNILIGKCT